jgi:hypothetical protein
MPKPSNLPATANDLCTCDHADRDHEKICLVATCPCDGFKHRPQLEPKEKPEEKKPDPVYDDYGGWWGI